MHFLSSGMQFLIPKPWPFWSFSEKLKLFINPFLTWWGSNSKFCLSYIGQLLKYLFNYFNLLAVIFFLGSFAHIRVNHKLKGNLYTDFGALSLWFLHLGVSHSIEPLGQHQTDSSGQQDWFSSEFCLLYALQPRERPKEKHLNIGSYPMWCPLPKIKTSLV